MATAAVTARSRFEVAAADEASHDEPVDPTAPPRYAPTAEEAAEGQGCRIEMGCRRACEEETAVLGVKAGVGKSRGSQGLEQLRRLVGELCR